MMRFHDKPKKQGGLYSLNLGQNVFFDDCLLI